MLKSADQYPPFFPWLFIPTSGRSPDAYPVSVGCPNGRVTRMLQAPRFILAAPNASACHAASMEIRTKPPSADAGVTEIARPVESKAAPSSGANSFDKAISLTND